MIPRFLLTAAFALFAGLTLVLTRNGLRDCDAELRHWYDLNVGKKQVA